MASIVTNADKVGNTPAYQGYTEGKKNVKTGEPIYEAASHLKENTQKLYVSPWSKALLKYNQKMEQQDV